VRNKKAMSLRRFLNFFDHLTPRLKNELAKDQKVIEKYRAYCNAIDNGDYNAAATEFLAAMNGGR
jgi:hypothetical protein